MMDVDNSDMHPETTDSETTASRLSVAPTEKGTPAPEGEQERVLQEMARKYWGFLDLLSGEKGTWIGLPLTDKVVKIGRGKDNNIRHTESHISDCHCVLKWEGGESVSIADSSTNGTYLNESKILKGETRMLRDGSEICLGMKIRYVYRHLAKPPKNELERLFDFDVNIGDGSTAVVHRALHRASGEFFAIKLITFKNVGKFQYDQSKKLVESEIEILKTLDHPHVCSLLMSVQDNTNGMIGIVLPYMNGGNLSIYMNKYPDGVPEILAKDITYQICTGMAYVHEQGVVHRDLKPDNILVTIDEPPFVTIADFGVSKLVEGRQKLRTVCGTPLYAAPELGNAPVAHYTNLVDCFSVGVVIYEMLTGEQLFERDAGAPSVNPFTEGAEIKKVIMQRYPCMNNRKLTEHSRDVIEKLLCREPRARLSMASALIHDWLRYHAPAYNSQTLAPKSVIESRITRSLGRAVAADVELLRSPVKPSARVPLSTISSASPAPGTLGPSKSKRAQSTQNRKRIPKTPVRPKDIAKVTSKAKSRRSKAAVVQRQPRIRPSWFYVEVDEDGDTPMDSVPEIPLGRGMRAKKVTWKVQGDEIQRK